MEMDVGLEQVRRYRLRGHHLDRKLPPEGLLAAAGACVVQNSPPGLDIWLRSGYNHPRIQRGRGEVPVTMLHREPLDGEKGRANGGEYTLELAPQRLLAQ